VLGIGVMVGSGDEEGTEQDKRLRPNNTRTTFVTKENNKINLFKIELQVFFIYHFTIRQYPGKEITN